MYNITSSDIIVATLENLIKTGKGQYVKNVWEMINDEHDWTEEEFDNNIKQAVADKIVTEIRFRDIPSLRIVAKEGANVTIMDSAYDQIIQTDTQHSSVIPEQYPTMEDFVSFKRHIGDVTSNISSTVNETLLNFKGQLDNVHKMTDAAKSVQNTQPLNYEKLLIESLHDRVKFLEKVVDNQNVTIQQQQGIIKSMCTAPSLRPDID